MDRTIAIHHCVLIEVLRYGQAHKDGEPEHELYPEAVQITELKQAKTGGTCSSIIEREKLTTLQRHDKTYFL